MFYRKRIFLALLEAFGTNLECTDFQNLLLLFCQRSGQNYYDFFPYKFGGFSFISYKDKNDLIKENLLKAADAFELVAVNDTTESRILHQSQLKPRDISYLNILVEEIGDLRGSKLVQKVYLEFPTYTLHSQLLSALLNSSEQAQVKRPGKLKAVQKYLQLVMKGYLLMLILIYLFLTT